MGSWSQLHDREQLVFRGQIDRETFSRGYFWMVLGRRTGAWIAGGAPFFLLWIPMRLFGSGSKTSGWAVADYAMGCSILVFPVAFFWYWGWFYDRLTADQRTFEITLDSWGLRIAPGVGALLELPWSDLASCHEGKNAFYVTTAKGRCFILPKCAAADEVRRVLSTHMSVRPSTRLLSWGRRTRG